MRPRRTVLHRAGGLRHAAAVLVLLGTGGCGDAGAPLAPTPEAASLEVISGTGQRFDGGRRSPEAFRVRARTVSGAPLAGAEVTFRLRLGGGVLSQPLAVTDGNGIAETFVLEARAGEGEVEALSGDLRVGIPFQVDRAPGQLVFDSTRGLEGLPSLPHPEPILAVTLLDSDGLPLPDRPVWFAASGELEAWVDTTDASGRASTRLLRSGPEAGEGAVFAFVPGFPEVLAADRRPVRPPVRRVVIVSIEGLRGDAIGTLAPPTLARLSREGAWTDRAETVLPTLTVPAHLSMLAGVPPAEHGIFADRLQVTQEMAGLEPLFRRARRGGAPGAAVMSREGPLAGFGEVLECRQAFGLDRLTLTAPTGAAALPAALEALSDSALALLFVHLPDPDVAGHAHGWSSPEYRDAVLEADAVLGRLVDAARGEDGRETMFLVTSPHGGGGAFGPFQHGSDSPEDRQVPLVLHGPGIEAGTALQGVSILDVAPTALWGLGIAPPADYRGRVIPVHRLAGAGSPAATPPPF